MADDTTASRTTVFTTAPNDNPRWDDPLWYKDAVIYQLHIKSFFDSNNDGVGDFAGLSAKLDYIAGLGVTAVWLLPFYPSPRRDDGYDIAGYTDVHPDYGTLEDARRFIAEAHARGIRVVTELVINHTSDQHPWFQAARQAPAGSPERDIYVWSDDDRKWPETRIIFLDTETSNWTWDPVAGAYFWHRFYSHQPDLNFDNPAVLERVLDVMRFWMEAGVDGLRLDAIPYLVERDGTNNENLPETHAILKQIRAALDASFPGRMLLAEANQWPEDTLQYFGDGDECHMAFNFPLMPRMYMAIAQEDRFPITDILRQTPELAPENQWAIFLRNHDELTLEMVTDKERDYLWSTYASDKRARINLGIRRRLAPLMERDRQRIELMNGLLLTMPGTPVIYYGDEIGMGDNIHLGDRDGVRTPMQWSPDRNGGFSRADPAELILPPIMDPLYGFQAINVEAQSRDPHSLLNWLKRMLAVRKEHQAFGRGRLRFLRPQNRKVLAYLREYEGDVILCVANVGRTAQAVELDLSEFAGRVPLELSGRTPFPRIGQLTYLLTLPPHGFYWFQLREDAEAPSWSSATSGISPEHHTFVIRNGLADVMRPANQEVLEREVLPDYLPGRRWFQGKDVAQAGGVGAEVIDWALLPGGDVVLALLRAQTGNTQSLYALPLGVAWEDKPTGPYAPQLSLARVRQGRSVGLLTDGFATPEFARGVVAALRDQAVISAGAAEIRFTAYPGFELEPEMAAEWMAAEQSNSSMIIGRACVLKLLRQLSPGMHPELEMTRLLTERGFANTAQLMGEVSHVAADGERHVLMIAQRFVYNQGDGWSWTLDRLKRRLDELVLADGALGITDDKLGASGENDARFESYVSFANTLGRRLAEMHAVLAQPCDDPAFSPELTTPQDASALAEAVRRQLAAALEHLHRAAPALEPALGELATRLTTQADALNARIAGLSTGAVGALRTRIHGDLHLGQVLIASADVVIIDFEGEPAKPLDQRRAKQLPLRDVAGVLRSFDYAAGKVGRDLATLGPSQLAKAQAALERFRTISAEAFLAGYAEGGGGIDPALLDLLQLEKAAYEVVYEAANRPDWLDVPLRGLATLAERLLAEEL
jgi:maltose alpha-D-glucosyltransferase/alpha-amylase